MLTHKLLKLHTAICNINYDNRMCYCTSTLHCPSCHVEYLAKSLYIYIITGMINGQLSVRPSKIVAGHEPEKTNEFLQAMGMAILNKVSLC